MRRYFEVMLVSLVLISGCSKDDNPVEPKTPDIPAVTAIPFWYDGTTYSADSLVKWGLGSLLTEYYHNDVDYSWYIDQGNTGYASNNNCGPTCVTMVLKWLDKNFSKTVEDARDTYPNNGGWWYTNNIINYLNIYSVYTSTVQYTDSLQLQNLIKNGNVIILCIDTQYLKYNSNQTQRINRFYSYQGGHFIVIKGVRSIDNKLYFEAYDPNNWNMNYSDNSPKGKNRHYRPSDLTLAISKWWNYVIVVSKNKLSKSIEASSVNTETITHAWGK